MDEQPTARRVRGRVSDPDALAWQLRAEAEHAAALPRIRAVAEKWLATIGSVTAVFGLVTFLGGRSDLQKLPAGARAVAGVLVLTALVLLLAAIVIGAYAAQGTPHEMWNSGSEYRRWVDDSTRRATRHLRTSRMLALAGALAYTAFVAVVWYA